jgi:hypothetical protein
MVHWRPFLGSIALFLGCFAVFPMPIVGWGFTHLPGDLIDSRFNNCILEHGYLSLILGQGDFWNAPFCFPARGVTACSDTHLGNLPIYAMFRSCRAGPERSFQLWWLSTFALTYAAGIAGARLMGLRSFGACLASAAFTFSPLMATNCGHAQLNPRYFLPLTVGFYWLFLKDAKAKHLLAAMLAWVGQMYSSFYLGYFLGLFLGAISLTSLLTHVVAWRPLILPRWYEWGKRAAVCSFALLLLWPALKPYAASDGQKFRPDPAIALVHLPQPFDWISPHPCSAMWGDIGRLRTIFFSHSKYAFFGGIGMIGAAVGAVAIAVWVFSARRRGLYRVPAAWALATFSLGLFFTGFHQNSLYELALKLPMIAGLRATSRIALMLAWPLSLLCGRWVDQWMERRPKWSTAIAISFAVFAVADVRIADNSCGRYCIDEAIDRKMRIADQLRKHPEMKCFYIFPGPMQPSLYVALTHQVDAICAGQIVGVPTINGWTGQWPLGWEPFESYSQVLEWMRENESRYPGCSEGLVFFGIPSLPEFDLQAEEFRKTHPPVPIELEKFVQGGRR